MYKIVSAKQTAEREEKMGGGVMYDNWFFGRLIYIFLHGLTYKL